VIQAFLFRRSNSQRRLAIKTRGSAPGIILRFIGSDRPDSRSRGYIYNKPDVQHLRRLVGR